MQLRILAVAAVLILATVGCKQPGSHGQPKNLDTLMAGYWEESLRLDPLSATSAGDNRYNDRMVISISESFRDTLRAFYTKYLTDLGAIDTGSLDAGHLLSYRLLKYEMQKGIEGLKFPSHLMPINQFWGLTLDLPQLGSGSGNQPFKTVKDYDDFLKRMSVFPAWTDTAIANMRKGMATGWVLPKALVVKILPQLSAIADVQVADSSIFFGPIKAFPDSLAKDKDRLTAAYRTMIETVVRPSYGRLYTFMKTEYLPKARAGSGISDIPQGREYYQYLINNWTTTNLTPDSIYNLGQAEVARIEDEMTAVKESVGFKGSLQEFFQYQNTDRQFFPFKTPEAVLDSFRAIHKAEEPALKRLFNHVPKTAFTIRQTQAFRAASASAEYNQPSEDGTRPGIFYVPILDATKFNAIGMETLFLHEAIPGHHYQIALQQENKSLPKFRRFLWYGAYGEGWALYSESLGKELGLYQNPYQYFGHLSDEMHRALRLVVDVGIHAKGMTREQAIDYMLAHERTTREEATAEVERYMAIPAQALSYKIGQLTIRALRTKYEAAMGKDFSIQAFHDQVLDGGCVPLNILTQNMADWAASRK